MNTCRSFLTTASDSIPNIICNKYDDTNNSNLCISNDKLFREKLIDANNTGDNISKSSRNFLTKCSTNIPTL